MNPALDNNNQGPSPQIPSKSGNIIADFLEFKKTLTGNPEQTVKDLLASGRMSQQQFNQLSQMANGLRNILH